MSPRHPHPSIRATSGFLAAVILLQGCLSHRIEVQPISLVPVDSVVTVTTPTKVQLIDGDVVYFAEGLSLTPAVVSGEGTRYSLALATLGAVTELPRDSIAAITWFSAPIDAKDSATGSLGVAAAILLFGAVALSATIYGGF